MRRCLQRKIDQLNSQFPAKSSNKLLRFRFELLLLKKTIDFTVLSNCCLGEVKDTSRTRGESGDEQEPGGPPNFCLVSDTHFLK